MIYIDLFSGIGGFALGAYWSGIRFDKHYFSEVDKDAVELYRKRCPDAIPLGDITKVDWKAFMDDTKGQRRHDGITTNKRQAAGNVDSFSDTDEIRQEYIITGGFPCQDLSVAGKGAGLEGSRSGLWTAMFEAIRILRPRYVIIENVGAIVGWFPRIPAGQPPDNAIYMEDGTRMLDVEQYQAIEPVLADLNSIFYDAEGQDIRAEDMGAPHKRERIWIVAYPNGSRNAQPGLQQPNISAKSSQDVSNPDRKHGNDAGHGTSEICRERSEQAEVQRDKVVADSTDEGSLGREREQGNVERQNKERGFDTTGSGTNGRSEDVPNPEGSRDRRQQRGCGYQDEQHNKKNGQEIRCQPYNSSKSIGKSECNRSRPGEWLPEPCMGVLVDGLPAGMDRFEGRLSNKSYKKAAQIKGIGNAILPQIAELFFRWIKDLI